MYPVCRIRSRRRRYRGSGLAKENSRIFWLAGLELPEDGGTDRGPLADLAGRERMEHEAMDEFDVGGRGRLDRLAAGRGEHHVRPSAVRLAFLLGHQAPGGQPGDLL